MSFVPMSNAPRKPARPLDERRKSRLAWTSGIAAFAVGALAMVAVSWGDNSRMVHTDTSELLWLIVIPMAPIAAVIVVGLASAIVGAIGYSIWARAPVPVLLALAGGVLLFRAVMSFGHQIGPALGFR
jgi:hypothetical protein